jgi:hypothetical protein
MSGLAAWLTRHAKRVECRRLPTVHSPSVSFALGNPGFFPERWTTGPSSHFIPHRTQHDEDSGANHDLRGGLPDVRLEELSQKVTGWMGHLRGPFTAHIREETRSCTATRASHVPRRIFREHRGWSRRRPGRTATRSASPRKGPSTNPCATNGETMRVPPALAAPGPAWRASSPILSTAPGVRSM